jgi:hypothetical protein
MALSPEMHDLVTILKHLGVSRDDIMAIALLVAHDERLTDKLSMFIVNKIDSGDNPTLDEISEKALQLAGVPI